MTTGYAMNDHLTLTDAENDLFKDADIEAAFQGWAHVMVTQNNKSLDLRKQFLMRLRFLFQSGQLGRY